jgi:hypothetical protein
VAAFVDRAIVEAAIMTGVQGVPPDRDRHHVGFCDPAGGSGADSMTLAVPVSPVMSTVESIGATFDTRASAAQSAAEVPTISSNVGTLGGAAGRVPKNSLDQR